MIVEEAVAHHRAENAQLKEQLRLALERIAELEAKLEHLASGADVPSFVKPCTPKIDKTQQQPRGRGKRAKSLPAAQPKRPRPKWC